MGSETYKILKNWIDQISYIYVPDSMESGPYSKLGKVTNIFLYKVYSITLEFRW